MMKLIGAVIHWVMQQIEGEQESGVHWQPPWGHTLTLTVGPSALTHDWRCYEPGHAPCRTGREEAEGCRYIEVINECGKPWYALTVDGYDEEFPPLQVDFAVCGGEYRWFNPAVGS